MNEEGVDPYRALSKGAFVPQKQHLPFQTKIQRHYPTAKLVPSSGMTTEELVKTRQQKDGRGAKNNSLSRASSIYPAQLYPSPYENSLPLQHHDLPKPINKKHFLDRSNLSCSLDPHYLATGGVPRTSSATPCADLAFRRPLVRLTSMSRETSSIQARILLESQYPPFHVRTKNPRSRLPRGSGSRMGRECRSQEDLVSESATITDCIRRPGPVGRKNLLPSILAHAYYCQPSDATTPMEDDGPSLRKRSELKLDGEVQLIKSRIASGHGNIFSYGLPKRRTKVYHGCVESRASAVGLRGREHSVEADGLFILPKPTANIRDVKRPLKQMMPQRWKHKLGPDLLPHQDAGDDFLDSRPTKAIHTLRKKCIDNMTLHHADETSTRHTAASFPVVRRHNKFQYGTQVAEIFVHS